MIYDVENLVRGLAGIENTKEALGYFRDKTIKAGFTGLELQLACWGKHLNNVSGVDGMHKMSSEELTSILKIDSITNYQFAHFCDMNRNYDDILSDVKKEWKRIDTEYSVPFYPHVSIGWDNNPRFLNFVPNVCKGNTPQKFAEALKLAKDYVDSHNLPVPLITVNSWNEWTETSYLEPDSEYGYGYLEAIKDIFVDGKL